MVPGIIVTIHDLLFTITIDVTDKAPMILLATPTIGELMVREICPDTSPEKERAADDTPIVTVKCPDHGHSSRGYDIDTSRK